MIQSGELRSDEVPAESPQIPAKFTLRASKYCVCNARRLQPVVLLTEGLEVRVLKSQFRTFRFNVSPEHASCRAAPKPELFCKC